MEKSGRVHWRPVLTILWSTWRLVIFSPSGWRSCRLPASPQNTPTSSVNSSKHPTTIRCRKQSSLVVCPYTVLLDPFQFHPPPRWGLLHRAPEKHRSWTSSWLLPRAECEENPSRSFLMWTATQRNLTVFLFFFLDCCGSYQIFRRLHQDSADCVWSVWTLPKTAFPSSL